MFSSPLPQMAAREKAECLNCVCFEILCPKPIALCTHLTVAPKLFLDSVSFSPDKLESLLSNIDSDSATGPDGISPRVLKTCSSALAHPLSVLFTLSYAQDHLPPACKSEKLLPCIERCKNRSLQLQTNQSSPNHQQGYEIHHHFRHQILPLLQWLDFRSSIWFQTRSLYPGYAASALPTMDGSPQCQTGNPSRIPGHITCF